MNLIFPLLVLLSHYFNNNSFATPILETLKAAQVIFRHGARTIDQVYPNDPYKDESLWPDGFHQLTCIGKTQGYRLGSYLRERYSGFLNTSYNAKEIHVLSSDIDRTIQTAYAVTAGIYNSDLIQENNEDCKLIPWTSVPVHTIPDKVDNILKQRAICGKYTLLLDDFYDYSPVVAKLVMDNRELLEYFGNNSGVHIKRTSDFSLYYDSLVIENYYNLTLPEWTNSFFNSKEANVFGTFYFAALTYTDEMKRLRVGPILDTILTNFESGKRVHLLSGHDHTLTGILDVLGLYSHQLRPTFASAIIFEVHQNIREELEILMFYRNESGLEAYELNIPKCPSPCSYQKFISLLTPFIPQDWEKECQLHTHSLYGGILWTLLIVGSCIGGIAILTFFIKWVLSKTNKYEQI